MCDPYGEPIVPVFHEFYANLKVTIDDTKYVQGKSVNISPAYINSVLECTLRAESKKVNIFNQFTAGARESVDIVLCSRH